jgi:hypothetical protein
MRDAGIVAVLVLCTGCMGIVSGDDYEGPFVTTGGG